MTNKWRLRGGYAAVALTSIATVCLAAAGFGHSTQQAANQSADPWTARDVLRPASLAVQMSMGPGSHTPLIVCVGFGTLYREAHIRGAQYYGPASTPDGLADLKKWAASQPRDREIVIYCGCCPFVHCPNIRPAFTVLQSLGFKSVRVLVLDTGLGRDWIEKGFPTERHVNS